MLNNREVPEFQEKLIKIQAKLTEQRKLNRPNRWFEDALETGDSKDAWRVLNSLCQPKRSKQLSKPDLEKWVQKFADVSKVKQPKKHGAQLRAVRRNIQRMQKGSLDYEITPEEVSWAIRSLNMSRAEGHDGIFAEMIKLAAGVDGFTGLVLALFKACFRDSKIPTAWRKSNLILLSKKMATNNN